ncbi:MAG: DNA-3-methyladenine glycosylase [Candidatus Acidiferrum sp.]
MKRFSLKVRRLARKELPRDTLELARFLIGKVVVRELPEGRLSGRIVEAEGYPPGDPAGHHFRGPTQRNRSLFLRHGHVYVFFNYGMHFMLNVSSERAGVGGGVLIRALEPLEGIELMQRHRKSAELLDLTRGPGRLAAALRIDRGLDGIDLFSRGPLWLGVLLSSKADKSGKQPVAEVRVGRTVRIGITHAANKLFRFYERGNPFVSGPKRLLLPNPAQKKANG